MPLAFPLRPGSPARRRILRCRGPSRTTYAGHPLGEDRTARLGLGLVAALGFGLAALPAVLAALGRGGVVRPGLFSLALTVLRAASAAFATRPREVSEQL